MLVSCYKTRHSFCVAEADWMLEQAADTQTFQRSGLPRCVIGRVFGCSPTFWGCWCLHLQDQGVRKNSFRVDGPWRSMHHDPL